MLSDISFGGPVVIDGLLLQVAVQETFSDKVRINTWPFAASKGANASRTYCSVSMLVVGNTNSKTMSEARDEGKIEERKKERVIINAELSMWGLPMRQGPGAFKPFTWCIT